MRLPGRRIPALLLALFMGLAVLPLSPAAQEGDPDAPPLLWKRAVGGAVISPPALGPGGHIFFSADDRQLHCLNPEGDELWACPLPGMPQGDVMTAGDGRCYVFTREGAVHSVSPRGSLLWSRPLGGPLQEAALLPGGGVALLLQEGMLRVFGPWGDFLWEKQLSGSAEGIWVVQQGRLAVAHGAGQLSLWTPWGREEGKFRLNSPVTAFCCDEEGRMVAATEAGKIFGLDSLMAGGEGGLSDSGDSEERVSSYGRMSGVAGGSAADGREGILWQKEGPSALQGMILTAPGEIRAWDDQGGIWLIRSGGIIEKETLLPGGSLPFTSALISSRGAWFSLAGQELRRSGGDPLQNSWRLENREGWSGIVLGGDRLYAGGRDWILYAFAASGHPRTVWNNPRGNAGRSNGVLQSFNPSRWEKIYRGQGNFEYLRRLAGSENVSDQYRVVREITRETRNHQWRRTMPYAPLLLIHIIQGWGESNPGRGVTTPSGYAPVQGEALLLLGKMEAYEMRALVLQIVGNTDDPVIRRFGVLSLGAFGSDPDGGALDLYRHLLSRHPREEDLISSLIQGISLLAEGGGAFRHEEAAGLLAEIAMGGGLSPARRRRALQLLRNLTSGKR